MTKPTSFDVLVATRAVFASTHWAYGNLLLEGAKPRMCALGGLRVTATLLAQDVADVVVKLGEFDAGADWSELDYAAARGMDEEFYKDAVRDLAMTVDPERYGDMLALDITPTITACEDLVVDWNDSFDDVGGILVGFDQAIEGRRGRDMSGA